MLWGTIFKAHIQELAFPAAGTEHGYLTVYSTLAIIHAVILAVDMSLLSSILELEIKGLHDLFEHA